MKTHAFFLRFTLAVGIALIALVCVIAQTHKPGVLIHETSIKIHPGTRISGDDQKALDDVLTHYNKSLYKIWTYDRGKVVKKQGSLKGARIDKRLVAEANEAALKGVSYLALQIGSEGPPPPPSSTTPTPEPTRPVDVNPVVQHLPVRIPPPIKGKPTPTPGSTVEPMEVGEMIHRVTPILQKYGQ
jgi:hypothetical protein